MASLGIFKFSWYRDANQELAIHENWLPYIQGLFVVIPVAFVLAAYFLFTERSRLRAWLAKQDSDLGSRFSTFGWLPEDTPKGNAAIGDRAITELWLSKEEADRLASLPADQIWHVRADHLRLAYLRLVGSNRRVSERIEAGVVLMGFAFLLLGAATALYILGVGEG